MQAEQNDPKNPPNSMLKLETRRAALWSYLGSVIILFIIVGAALAYWMSRGPVLQERDSNVTQAVGTAGDTTPGGGDPQPRPGSTSDELRNRGAGEPSQGPNPGLSDVGPLTELSTISKVDAKSAVGQRVALNDIEVESARGTDVWLRHGDSRVAATLPSESAPLHAGDRIDIAGTLQPDGRGGIHIVATHVNATKN